jgi:hypothetical protein
MVLRTFIPESYHLACLQGAHEAAIVLEDAVLTWRLVKVGGVLLFGDYDFQFPEGVNQDSPKIAIDAFLTIFSKKINVLHKAHHVLIEKVAD